MSPSDAPHPFCAIVAHEWRKEYRLAWKSGETFLQIWLMPAFTLALKESAVLNRSWKSNSHEDSLSVDRYFSKVGMINCGTLISKYALSLLDLQLFLQTLNDVFVKNVAKFATFSIL